MNLLDVASMLTGGISDLAQGKVMGEGSVNLVESVFPRNTFLGQIVPSLFLPAQTGMRDIKDIMTDDAIGPVEKVSQTVERMADPTNSVNYSLENIGSVLPDSVKKAAPTIGATIGTLAKPVGGTALGYGIGAHLADQTATEALLGSGLSATAAWAGGAAGDKMFGPGAPGVGATETGGSAIGSTMSHLESYAMGGSSAAIRDALAAETIGKLSPEGAQYAMEGNVDRIADQAIPQMLPNTTDSSIPTSEIVKDVGKLLKTLLEKDEADIPTAPESAGMFGSTTEITPEQQTYMKRVANTGLSSAAKPNMLFDDWAFNTKKAWSGLSLADLLKIQNWTKEKGNDRL